MKRKTYRTPYGTPEQIYTTLTEKKSRHGNCTDWIRENRRRRSAGLPQKRSLSVGIFDPLHKTITKILKDGTQEITSCQSRPLN